MSNNNTCEGCIHKNVCKYEDALNDLMSKFDTIVSENNIEFVTGYELKCDHKEGRHLTTKAPLWGTPGMRDLSTNPWNGPTVINETGTTPVTTLRSGVVDVGTAQQSNYGISSREVVESIRDRVHNDMGSITVTDDKGVHQQISQTLNSVKKTGARPSTEGIVGSAVGTGTINNTQFLKTEPNVSVMDTSNVPVETINPDDLPPEFRTLVNDFNSMPDVVDNTERPETPGETSNV